MIHGEAEVAREACRIRILVYNISFPKIKSNLYLFVFDVRKYHIS